MRERVVRYPLGRFICAHGQCCDFAGQITVQKNLPNHRAYQPVQYRYLRTKTVEWVGCSRSDVKSEKLQSCQDCTVVFQLVMP